MDPNEAEDTFNKVTKTCNSVTNKEVSQEEEVTDALSVVNVKTPKKKGQA